MQQLTEKNASESVETNCLSTPRGFWLRFAGSAVIATSVVLTGAGIGVGYYDPELIDLRRANR